MAVMDIITYGHPTLRKQAEKCDVNHVDQAFIKDMIETMYLKDGVGLAAPQVNVSKQFLVCQDGEQEYILINPKIIAHSETRSAEYEGCLSLPGLHAKVPRHDKVVVEAFNQEGNKVEIKARGLLAVVLQHEIDHLNGVS
ncbi:MAG: peptide deformylase [candidate division KSB1 bacterium]|nr:peptide deformylase [candidate division KSB1 bacterium]